MYKFQHTPYFWYLLVIPVCVFIYYIFLNQREKKIKKLGHAHVIHALMPERNATLEKYKFILLMGALLFTILGLANLRSVSNTQKITRKGNDVIIALDVSNSMLANDIQPSRLEKAKQLVQKLTEKIANNRVGLVLFAGRAYVSVPITVDIDAVKMNLSIADPSMIPSQGTALSAAIETCRNAFNKKQASYKSIILISDGEDHEEAAIEQAKKTNDEGIVIQTVGIGSADGTTIIDPETQQAKLDENGEKIISKLNEKELKTIADETDGNYYLLQNTETIASDIANEINSQDQKNTGDSLYTSYNSYFQYFLCIALLLILIDFFMPNIRKDKKIFTLNALLLLLLCKTFGAQAQTSNVTLYKGNQAYKKGNFEAATKKYTEAFEANKNREAQYNLGNALYMQHHIEEAQKQYEQAAVLSGNKTLKAQAAHNMGNTLLDQKKYKEAIDWYKKSLIDNPSSATTKYNLAYAMQKLNEQNKQNQNQHKDQQQKDKQDEKKKQEEQQKKEQQEKQKQEQQQKQQQEKEKQQPQNSSANDDKNKQQEEQDKKESGPTMPSKLTKQQAEQLLNALNQEEKKLKEKKEKQKGVPVRLKKDW